MTDYNKDAAAYKHLNSNATTVVAGAPGKLCRVVVNEPGSGNTVTIYDNTAGSGTVIATLQPTAPATLEYNLATANGITVVQSGGTAADITVTYE